MQVKLKDVRLSFPDIWEAKEFKPGDGKPRYNASFLVVPNSENDKRIRLAIIEVAKELYGEKNYEKTLKGFVGQGNKYCYIDGDTKAYDGYQGMWCLSSHRAAKLGPVGVYDNANDPVTGKVKVLAEASGRPYAGCYVNAAVEIFAQKGENAGIRCGLTSVQFWRDGDSFSGAKPATPDDFEAMEEGADASSMA